jgi:hypothetical protein
VSKLGQTKRQHRLALLKLRAEYSTDKELFQVLRVTTNQQFASWAQQLLAESDP